ncbi:MAG: EAL domain-containing protein [Halieaceae bacterium]
MNNRLTIAGRINAYVISLAVFAAIGVGGYSIYQAYEERLGEIIDRAQWQSREGAQHQFAFYYRDEEVLEQLIEPFFNTLDVNYVAVFDSVGEPLASRHSAELMSYAYTDYFYLREGYGELDIGRIDHPFTPGKAQFIDVTLPVFSPINPLEKGLSRRQLAERITETRAVDSQFLVGYYHLGISREEMVKSLRPYAEQVAIYVGAFLLGVITLTLLITRSITAPLASLADMASEISSGRLDSKIKARGSGEIREITSMLNNVMGELNKYKSKMDTDHHLLSMKVEERTAQLSKRNEELNEAVKQVTQTKNRLRQLAYYDGLTSLPNRQLFTEQLDMLLRMAKREGQIIALLFLDLDNFKRINDSLGHSAGDMLLREVATRLSACVRNSDLLAKYVDSEAKIGVSRLGGDEFTVVLNNIDTPDTAGDIAERLLESLQAPMIIEGHELVITPSVGIALAPQDAETVEELLKLADTAMYHAKAAGRNKYSFYASSMKGSGVGRLKLETELRKAIERDELVLHYQPQVDTMTGEIRGAEALIRWNHPKHGMVPPIRFIPLAEEMGLIVDIGSWTLQEAARQSKLFQEQGLKTPKIAVNVSSLQFNASFTKHVQQILNNAKLEPSYLEVELTEGVIMNNAKASIEALHDLKQLGVSISVDDFGTGYSSLSYLSKFPLDELKIDRSFVIDFDKSVNSASLVSAIIAMGKSLNLSLVAEGVDMDEQFLFLRDNEVDIIQGYLFSKPVPGDELAELLRNNHFGQQIQDIVNRDAPVKESELAIQT